MEWNRINHRKKIVTGNPRFVELKEKYCSGAHMPFLRRGYCYHPRAHVFSPKGIGIPAQGKRVFERRPGFRFRVIVGALKGHWNAINAIRVKK